MAKDSQSRLVYGSFTNTIDPYECAETKMGVCEWVGRVLVQVCENGVGKTRCVVNMYKQPLESYIYK